MLPNAIFGALGFSNIWSSSNFNKPLGLHTWFCLTTDIEKPKKSAYQTNLQIFPCVCPVTRHLWSSGPTLSSLLPPSDLSVEHRTKCALPLSACTRRAKKMIGFKLTLLSKPEAATLIWHTIRTTVWEKKSKYTENILDAFQSCVLIYKKYPQFETDVRRKSHDF